MERFKELLGRQLALHPSIQPRDVAKLCYQAACGAEHLLTDTEGVRRYFYEEYAAVPADGGLPLYEQISRGICRVNLGAWKAAGREPNRLLEMFLDSAHGDGGTVADYLDAAEAVIPFDREEWDRFRRAYAAEGFPPVRHTEAYRAAERPAYRVVDAKYIPMLMDPNK